MATFLPDKLNMLEYKPSMVGIPTQSVARLYDRLDKQAYAADAQSTKIKTALAAQIATANEQDAPYLQNMYNNVEGLIDQAKEEKNLPGYANQIRNMVGDMVSDQTFAGIQSNGKKKAKYEEDKNRLVMQLGAENVIDSGDNPANFATINPETQELQQFMGQVTKRPDYLSAMSSLYKTGTDILASEASLNEYVRGGQEGVPGAFEAYQDTPEGRIHLNDLSNQMFDTPFIRLPNGGEQSVQVVEAIKDKLYNAGLLKMKQGSQGLAEAWGSGKGMYAKEHNKAIQFSGPMSTTLTYGEEGMGQTLSAANDQVKDTAWDNQLLSLFQGDREHMMVDVGDESTKVIQASDKSDDWIGSSTGLVDPTRIQSVEMTSALSESGNPIVRAYISAVAGVGANKQGKMAPRYAYIEMPTEELPLLQSQSAGFMGQVYHNTHDASKQAALPLVANLYAPELGRFVMNKEVDKVQIDRLGQTIQREEGGYFVPYDQNGVPVVEPTTNKQFRFKSPAEVRAYVGRSILNLYN